MIFSSHIVLVLLKWVQGLCHDQNFWYRLVPMYTLLVLAVRELRNNLMTPTPTTKLLEAYYNYNNTGIAFKKYPTFGRSSLTRNQN